MKSSVYELYSWKKKLLFILKKYFIDNFCLYLRYSVIINSKNSQIIKKSLQDNKYVKKKNFKARLQRTCIDFFIIIYYLNLNSLAKKRFCDHVPFVGGSQQYIWSKNYKWAFLTISGFIRIDKKIFSQVDVEKKFFSSNKNRKILRKSKQSLIN